MDASSAISQESPTSSGFTRTLLLELQAAFEEAVEDYLATCKQLNKPPQKQYSGKLKLRIPPDIHVAIAEAAEASGKRSGPMGNGNLHTCGFCAVEDPGSGGLIPKTGNIKICYGSFTFRYICNCDSRILCPCGGYGGAAPVIFGSFVRGFTANGAESDEEMQKQIEFINWKRGFFRLTLVLSILFGIFAGIINAEVYDSGGAFLAGFFVFFGLTWLIYFGIGFVVRGFASKR